MMIKKKVDEKAKMVSEKKKEIRKKKIQKFVYSFKKFFIDLYKNIKNKYVSMDKTAKQVLLIWVCVVLVIVGMIAFVSLNNVFMKKYTDMEKAMDNAALNYVNSTDLYGTKDEKVKLPLKSMLLSNDLTEEDLAHDSCDGFSIVYYDDELEKTVVESYISCDRYTSDFYNDY